MKKIILLLVFTLLFITGCSSEYNLTIKNGVYHEEVTLIGDSSEEISEFNQNWQIPIDKEEYNIGRDPDSNEIIPNDRIYKFENKQNRLKFSYDFTKDKYSKSSAVSNCYDTLNVSNYEGNIVISTSSKITCFDKYPNLNRITVNITTNEEVITNNADRVNGNVYTWNITRNQNKDINLVFVAQDEKTTIITPVVKNDSKKDYTLYIFCGILIILILVGYMIFNMIKQKSDSVDD